MRQRLLSVILLAIGLVTFFLNLRREREYTAPASYEFSSPELFLPFTSSSLSASSSSPLESSEAVTRAADLLYLEEYTRGRDPVHFSELVYVRPDLDELKREVKAAIGEIRDSQTLPETLEAMERARTALFTYDTMYVLSDFNHDTDLTSDYWYEELRFCDEGYAVYDSCWSDVYDALGKRTYGTQLRHIWDTYADLSSPRSRNSNKSDQLWSEMDEITDKALDIIWEATADFQGEALTLDEAYAHPSWVNACEAWYKENGDALLDLYVNYVTIGNRMAQNYYNSSNFAELAFDRLYRDYSPEMAQLLIDDIEEYILPLDGEIYDRGLWGNLSKPFGTFEDCLELSAEVLASMDSRMLDALTLMEEYGLYYVERGDNAYSRPYVHNLALPNTPIIFCPFYDNMGDVINFTHEFGHFYEQYLLMEYSCITDDLCEVHSQTMTMLFAQAQQAIVGNDRLLKCALADTVDTLANQAFNAAVELRVYALPDDRLTAGAIGKIGYEESLRYGFGSSSDLLARYEWLTDTELFTDPLQAFCYVPSAAVALEIWMVSTQSMDDALQLYDQFVLHEDSLQLLANIEASGIASPFDEGWAEKTHGFLREYLFGSAGSAAA